jgi:dTDP-4-amino-4,6-dideoxy-D-galactose acyltransferase
MPTPFEEQPLFRILDWDSRFFGFTVAKMIDPALPETQWDGLIAALRSAGITLLYWPILPDCEELKWRLNREGAQLVDCKVTYSLHIGDRARSFISPHLTLYQDKEACDRLVDISIQCGSYSRFKVDTRIPWHKCDELYRIWIQKAVKKELADDVLVYKRGDELAGLAALKTNGKKGNIILIGVDAAYRGNHAGSALAEASIGYFQNRCCEYVTAVTQAENKAACLFYERCGFTVVGTEHFYHLWLQ